MAFFSFCGGRAHAHGGPPVSLKVVRSQTGSMYVPVWYWGLWVGDADGPWRWICEEVITTHYQDTRDRRYGIATDGTLYAAHRFGISVSSDKGCSWTTQTLGVDPVSVASDIAVDPSDATVAHVTTATGLMGNQMTPPHNGLYTTHDGGVSFTRNAALAPLEARLFQSVRVAPSNAQVLYVTSRATSTPPDHQLHRSVDGGASFTTVDLSQLVALPPPATDSQAPTAVELFAVDPRDPDMIYLRAYTSPDGNGNSSHALWRSTDGGMTITEVLRVTGNASGRLQGIDDVAIDTVRGQVLVATVKGLYAGSDPGGAASLVLAPRGDLPQAQCVSVAPDGTIFACSSNVCPYLAALARSDDGGEHFHAIFSFRDTQGPVDYCPTGSQAAMTCPGIWTSYSGQLGVGSNESCDGGASATDLGPAPPDGGPGGGDSGCACEVGRRGETAPVIVLAIALLLALRFSAGRRSRG